jgi:hypothetical protein
VSTSSKISKRILGAGATVALSAGLGLALQVGAATPAHADVWDRVAACESSGDWNISTGNGFYGGLQFTQSTWEAYGGQGNPADASKAEQIRVAKKTLQGQGPGAWPVCSVEAGLTVENGLAAGGSSESGSSESGSGDSGSEASSQAPDSDYQGSGESVTIEAGDTLASIAAEQGVEGGWEALWSLNQDKISDPNVIIAGEQIKV